MKIKKNYSANIILAFLIIAVCIFSCKKEYITGGQPTNVDKYKEVTTFDYLKSTQQFDTLAQIIEAGNLQANINEAGTLFAVSNSVIFSYLNQRTLYLQENFDANAKFTLDSLKYYIKTNKNGTRDSLLMYFIPGEKLTADKLSNNGKVYQSGLAGNKVAVSYEFTKDGNLGYTNLVSGVPQVVYFTQLWKPYNIDQDNTAADVPNDVGIHTLVQSAFITTKTGVVNSLRPFNNLFYYGER
ncbi:hypothetical protein ACVWYG_001196 [Pedobacter sp. UYEF25]